MVKDGHAQDKGKRHPSIERHTIMSIMTGRHAFKGLSCPMHMEMHDHVSQYEMPMYKGKVKNGKGK